MTTTTKTIEAKRIPAVSGETMRNEGGQAIGLKLTFNGELTRTVMHTDLNHDIAAEALWHGVKQKLIDAAAISRDTKTGKSATVQQKMEAVLDVLNRITGPSGQWNAEREGGGQGSFLFAALCRMQPGKAPEAIRAWLDKKTDAERKALEVNPKIAAIIQAIRAERVKTDGIDTDAMLSELDDATEDGAEADGEQQ